MGLTKLTKQNSSEKVNDNKDVKVLAVRSRKITTTTITNTILVGQKLSMVAIKMTLSEGWQDVRVKKYGLRLLANKKQIVIRVKKPIFL